MSKKIRVEFHGIAVGGKPEVLGEVTWDGQQFSASVPWLKSVLDEPIVLHGRAIRSVEDPEAFMGSLHKKYRGTYLRASQAGAVGE